MECPEHSAPEPVFQEPWHAQVFALTVHLNESGAISWADWVTRFSDRLALHGLSRELDGGDDYFHVWLETLEGFLAETGTATPGEASEMRTAWEAAYLATPHGQPVKLAAQ